MQTSLWISIVMACLVIAQDGQTCEFISRNDKSAPEAIEVANYFNCKAYIALNKGPDFTEEKFNNWYLGMGWYKNPKGIRHVTPDWQCLLASPGVDHKVSQKLDINEPWEPLDWLELANICPSDPPIGACFPEPCLDGENRKPLPGNLKILNIAKCHVMLWEKGRTVAILSDQDGNRFIRVATTTHEQAQSDIVDPVPQLPEGWTLTNEVLQEDLELRPEGHSTLQTEGGARKKIGDFACGYTLVFDEHDNNYHSLTGVDITKYNLNPVLSGRTPYDHIFLRVLQAVLIALLVIISITYYTKRNGYCCFNKKQDTKIE